MQLKDFFAPLNIYNLSVFLIACLIFDSTGFWIAKILNLNHSQKYLRFIYWLFGLGIFVFLIFLLHLFLPLKAVYIWLILLSLASLSLPNYWYNKGLIDFYRYIKAYPFPFLLLIPILKPLYFLISAPPFYSDEMNYQFYSPARLALETRWPFLESIGVVGTGPSLYEMIPKTLNTAYWSFFSLTRTYVPARMLHFLIVFSVLFTISSYFKKNIGTLPGIIYAVFSLLLFAEYIFSSILGYVDAAPAALSNLYLVLIVDFIIKPAANKIYPLIIILGLMLGMKYTILVFVSLITIAALTILVIEKKDLLMKQLKGNLNLPLLNFFKHLGSILFVFITFGGFWYFKNLIVSGNPIYPMFFKCLHGWTCGGNAGILIGLIKFDLKHFWIIVDLLFQNSRGLFLSFIVVLIILILTGTRQRKQLITKILLLILITVPLELLIARKFSNFELRYYYHWLLLIPLVLSIFSVNLKVGRLSVLFLLLYIFPSIVLFKNLHRFYKGDYLYTMVRNYAMRQTNLYQWVDYYAPQTNEVIKWCGEKRPIQNLLVIDPSLIWSGSELRMFVVNCTLNIIGPAKEKDIDEYAKEVRIKYNNSYLVSFNRCGAQKPDLTFQPDTDMMRRHLLNMKLICNASEIMKNLYIIK